MGISYSMTTVSWLSSCKFFWVPIKMFCNPLSVASMSPCVLLQKANQCKYDWWMKNVFKIFWPTNFILQITSNDPSMNKFYHKVKDDSVWIVGAGQHGCCFLEHPEKGRLILRLNN